ncbi:hypothetical protein FAVG1_00327 [Fusarium avenaceum]|nr:hypothetical protein FAVG1_00327 [Fusarium avenaceum]
MAQRELLFIHGRAPRATGVSDGALDEYKNLIGDLYLTQNYTRKQVIAYLEGEMRFSISPSQFSKATKRWGFHKQPHGGISTRQQSNETASQHATDDTFESDRSYTANSVGVTDQRPLLTNESNKHPSVPNFTTPGSNITTLDPCLVLPYTPASQLNIERDLNNTFVWSLMHSRLDPDSDSDSDSDSDINFSSPTSEKSPEPWLLHEFPENTLESAEYLACCYHHTKAFNYYSTFFSSLEDMDSYERRARILDIARVATTRTNCELVRRMLETELELSNDPLVEEVETQGTPKEVEMSHMQSFLFHHHLAQIYAIQNNSALMQEHLDNASNFTKTFATQGTESIDLWTLLFLVQYKKDSQIPDGLLHSLQWDHESYGLNIDDCLQYCWEKLNPTKPLHEASMMYEAGQHTRTEPSGMSSLVLQNSSLHLRERSSILFTFLWKELQLTHGTLPWMSGHPTISSAHILMIVSRMIVKRSGLISKHPDDLNEPEGHVQMHPTNLKIYCDSLLGLFHDSWHALDHIKREFATQFVEHHKWFLPSASRGAVASKPPSQSQDYQIVALESVLASKRDGSKKTSENRHESTDNDLSKWLEEHKGQSIIGRFRNDIYVRRKYPPPTSNSSCLTASVSPHRTYLVALNGNPTISRPLASHSSCSSQRSYSSSLQRFKAAGLSLQHKLKPTMVLSENSDVLMDGDVLENLQEDECLDLESKIHDSF